MLARRATPGLALRVRVVYQDDEWDYSEGLHVTLHHQARTRWRTSGTCA